MKKTLFATLAALMFVLPSAATPVLGRAAQTPITGTEHMFFGAPGRVWVSGSWLQLRDLPLTGTFDFGSLEGTETQLVNAQLDPQTGDGHVWGSVTYTDDATGVTCSGTRVGTLDNYLITARIIAPCSDGSLLQGTLQDTSVVFPPGSPFPSEVYSDFDGALLGP